MNIVIHKVFEPGFAPESGRAKNSQVSELITTVSVWVCFGPFDDEDFYHAEDHPNAVAICRYASQLTGSEVVDGIAQMLDKLGHKYEVTEYPGD